MSTKRSTKSFFCKNSVIIRKLLPCYTTTTDPQSKEINWTTEWHKLSNSVGFKELKFSGSTHCPWKALFHGIRLFYPRNSESYAAFRWSGWHILCKLLCSKNEITKAVDNQKERFENICFYWRNCFEAFLFHKYYKYYKAQHFSGKWKSFKGHDVHIINFFRMSRTL